MLDSSLQSHDEKQLHHHQEILTAAQANVALIADDIWAYPVSTLLGPSEDPYRKLNRDLWITTCKIAANYEEISAGARPKKKRVRDVIPESRLASYGDFEYEDEPLLATAHICSDDSDYDDYDYDEDSSRAGDEANVKTKSETKNGNVDTDDEELEIFKSQPWMLDQVEENRCQYSFVQAVNMVPRPLAPLCVDVPEFFPKAPSWTSDEQAKPTQFYHASVESPYQEDLFQYKGQYACRKPVSIYQV
ncbi:hypothetical protein QAD02_024203 [Eretmocerus hayati]|uniref:Uncharacterized protein n=1 Tax=Eretmocerus hayati TaxID=131215 RepID=A0ACC2PZL6_9HYME|nr:hypothetical protein QAD02_024203 [Eretmocerus hayati]